MVSASSILAAMAIAASSPTSTDAFTTSSVRNSHTQLHAAATDDASARALSDYMAKSHEEKLKAVGAVEEKKNAEIADLKAEIELLKSSSSLAVAAPPAAPAPAAPVLAASELESKLASYQNFMSEYIVNAQNQKLLAVKEAELKAEKKFQERLDRLFEAGGMAPPGAAAAEVVVAAAAPVELTSYQSRNAYVAAAGAAGKSRWGEKEVAKASAEAAAQPVAAAPAASDGAAVSATSFESRNAQVAAAGAAGKSRWGDLEVAKASNGASAPAAVEEEPAAPAGPVSLEDRVNLGALMLAR